MKTFSNKYSVHDELKRLNDTIDRKILRGQSYTKEARLHKRLLRVVSSRKRFAWLARSFSFASFL